MGAVLFVGSTKSPIVVVDRHFFCPVIYHRLNGHNHSWHQFCSSSFFAKIGNIRVFVNGFPHPLPGQNFHNTVITLRMDKFFYSITDISDSVSSLRGGNAGL